jgi:alkylhydroperoxidase family enzyme
MATRPEHPRIPPLPEAERTDEARELLGQEAGAVGDLVQRPETPTLNIFTTLVRHPGLFRKWLPFGGKLLSGKLPARERELLILRTGWNTQSHYEWGQHVVISRAVGFTDEEINRVIDGPDAGGWTDLEATLLRAADELHADACISDRTWEVLARHYDDRQLIEIPMLVGQYHMVAFTLNTLGVEREPGVPGLPAR